MSKTYLSIVIGDEIEILDNTGVEDWTGRRFIATKVEDQVRHTCGTPTCTEVQGPAVFGDWGQGETYLWPNEVRLVTA